MNKWQKGIPSKTGWYWLLYRDDHSRVPVESAPLFYGGGKWFEGFDNWEAEDDNEWIGPLEEPELPEK